MLWLIGGFGWQMAFLFVYGLVKKVDLRLFAALLALVVCCLFRTYL
jgi:hypothetical protein